MNFQYPSAHFTSSVYWEPYSKLPKYYIEFFLSGTLSVSAAVTDLV